MHIEDWDSAYQQGETPWDRGAPSPPLEEYLARQPLRGRVLAPGCGRGHDVALLAGRGADVIGLDIAPTAIADARARYGALAERFVLGDLFALPAKWHGAFDAVVEHTCLSGLEPSLRPAYRRAIETALKPGGLLVGVWFINPDLDPGETGPPFGISLAELDALFRDGFEIVEDYTPTVGFEGRLGRERVRVLRKL